MERTIKPDTLKDQLNNMHVIDVRRKADHESSGECLSNAAWHNPEEVAQWADALPRDKEIILYCVRGGAVSNSIVDTLQAKGLNARFIEGGIEGWKAAGGATVAKK